MRGNHATATRSGWRNVDLSLERMFARGFLTEGDMYEIQETLLLLAERRERGDISEHMMEVVMRKLAEDKVRAWRERNGMKL